MCSKLWLAAFAASISGGFQHGFHQSVLNFIQGVVLEWYGDIYEMRDSDDSDLELMTPVTMATLSIGAILGGILMGVISIGMGRKMAILVSNGAMITGLFLMCFAPLALSYEIFIIGRLFMGIFVGMSSGLVPMYLIEIAPEEYRGLTGSAYGIMVAVGSLFSIIMSFEEVLGNADLWTVAISTCSIFSVLHFIMFGVCPESPKYLIINEEDEDECEAAILWLRSTYTIDEIDDELDDMHEELNVLHEIGPVDFGRMFTDQTIRSPLIICTVMMLGHQLCGVGSALSYSYYIIQDLNFSEVTAKYCVLGLVLEYLFVTIGAACLIEDVGRKILILASFGGMTFCTFFLALTAITERVNQYITVAGSYVTLVFHFFLVFSFSLGAGTIPWFITPEIHNYYARPMATSFVITIGWVANFLYHMTYLPIKEALGGNHYMFFFFCNLGTVIFLALTMRETMNDSAVDIIEMFYD